MDSGMLVPPEASSPLGADATKYDNRHVRDKIAVLHRAAIVLLAVVAVVTLCGDGLLVRSNLRRMGAEPRLVRGERVRSRFDPVAPAPPEVVDTSEAERLARDEEAEIARMTAKRSADAAQAAQRGLADTWGGADAEGEEGDSHDGAQEHRHGQTKAAAGAGGSEAAAPAAAAAWGLAPASECSGYFGNGFSDFQALVGGASGPGASGDGGEECVGGLSHTPTPLPRRRQASTSGAAGTPRRAPSTAARTRCAWRRPPCR